MRGMVVADVPGGGEANMRRDLEMASIAAAQSAVVVRFYHWKPRALSLGRFQNLSEKGLEWVSQLSPEQVVVRGTGGGAILHDDDWTYSVSVPGQTAKGQLRSLYCTVHCAVRLWLLEQGVAATTWGKGDEGGQFMCFERRSEQDLVVDGEKVLGSAQRRIGQVVLQHGSLLLGASPLYPTLRGLRELGMREESIPRFGSEAAGRLQRRVSESIGEMFGVEWEAGSW